MTGHANLLYFARTPIQQFSVQSVYGGIERIEKVGTMFLTKTIKLTNVQLVKKSKFNLISVSRLTDQVGIKVVFENDTAKLMRGGETFLTFRKMLNMYVWRNRKYDPTEEDVPKIAKIRTEDREQVNRELKIRNEKQAKADEKIFIY